MTKGMTRHSTFDLAALRRAVERAEDMAGVGARGPARFSDYASFAREVPIMGRADFAALSESVFRRPRAERFHVGTSSSTSGSPKLILSRANVKPGERSAADVDLIVSLRRGGVFHPEDVVANLFAVDQFSLLHHAACSIVEACGADIVPVGRLESGESGRAQRAQLARMKVNVLFGTPGSLIQIANLCGSTGAKLAVDRIVFTGEGLGEAKRRWLRSTLGARIAFRGLYGLSECGFIGLDGRGDDVYDVRESAYFTEVDPSGLLLVTSLDEKAPVPVLRYPTGDSAVLESREGRCLLKDIRRAGAEFNYMGNLVSYDRLRTLVTSAAGHADYSMQVELLTDERGIDQMIVHILEQGAGERRREQVLAALGAVPELREGAEKGAGRVAVRVSDLCGAALTPRLKEALIIDRRLGRP